jgi:hypothetical protein
MRLPAMHKNEMSYFHQTVGGKEMVCCHGCLVPFADMQACSESIGFMADVNFYYLEGTQH